MLLRLKNATRLVTKSTRQACSFAQAYKRYWPSIAHAMHQNQCALRRRTLSSRLRLSTPDQYKRCYFRRSKQWRRSCCAINQFTSEQLSIPWKHTTTIASISVPTTNYFPARFLHLLSHAMRCWLVYACGTVTTIGSTSRACKMPYRTSGKGCCQQIVFGNWMQAAARHS